MAGAGLLDIAHEVQERQWPHVAELVVRKAAFFQNGLDDCLGAVGQARLLVAGERKAQLGRVDQRIKAPAIGNAVGHLTDERHMNCGAVGVDIAGQAFAGDRLHDAVLHPCLDGHTSGGRFQHELLTAFALGDHVVVEQGGGRTDGVGARVDGVAHHFHDDVTGLRLGVGRRHDQVHRHLRDTVGLFEQHGAQAVGMVAQILHLLAYRRPGQLGNTAHHDAADIAAGMGIDDLKREFCAHAAVS